MKRLIIAILFSVILLSGCRMPVVGDEYTVTAIEYLECDGIGYSCYNYLVTISRNDPNSGGGTLSGNHLKFYTNKLFSVGDTVILTNKKTYICQQD